MKYMLSLFFLFFIVLGTALGQIKSPDEKIMISSQKNKTRIATNDKGELLINVSPKDRLKFKAKGWVCYSDFGAKGDGMTDDSDAIAATHAYANHPQLRFCAFRRQNNHCKSDWRLQFQPA